MVTPEKPFIDSIVDVDTFKHWIAGYRSDILARERKAAIQRNPLFEEMESLNEIQYENAISEFQRRPDANSGLRDLFAKSMIGAAFGFAGSEFHPAILIKCAWDTIPISLQGILDYEARQISGPKNVNISVWNTEIEFGVELELPSESKHVSRRSHDHIETSLRLNEDLGLKGHWLLYDKPPVEQGEILGGLHSVNRTIYHPSSKKATVQELRDIVE